MRSLSLLLFVSILVLTPTVPAHAYTIVSQVISLSTSATERSTSGARTTIRPSTLPVISSTTHRDSVASAWTGYLLTTRASELHLIIVEGQEIEATRVRALGSASLPTKTSCFRCLGVTPRGIAGVATSNRGAGVRMRALRSRRGSQKRPLAGVSGRQAEQTEAGFGAVSYEVNPNIPSVRVTQTTHTH